MMLNYLHLVGPRAAAMFRVAVAASRFTALARPDRVQLEIENWCR